MANFGQMRNQRNLVICDQLSQISLRNLQMLDSASNGGGGIRRLDICALVPRQFHMD
jgi:hypothetical protein